MKEPAVQPTCPRCGYDQSGAVAAWTESCPLDGVCSECGLEFVWVDVMRPDRNVVNGLFEHADGLGAWWALKTWWRALRPWSFWRWVPITVTPVPRRLVVWPLLVMALCWVTASLLSNSVYGLLVWRVSLNALPRGTFTTNHSVLVVNGWLDPIAMWSGVSWMFDPARWFTPLGAVLTMTLAWPLTMLVLTETMRSAKVKRTHVLRAACYSLAWVAIVPAIKLAGAGIGLVSVLFFVSAGAQGAMTMWSATWYLYRWWWGPVLVSAIWVSLWWWMALTRGFRIEKAGVVWGLLMIVSVLAGLVVLSLVGGMERIMATFFM